MPDGLRSLLLTTALAAADDSKAAREARATRQQLLDACLKKDLATIDRILHPDFTYGHSTADVNTTAEARKAAGASFRNIVVHPGRPVSQPTRRA